MNHEGHEERGREEDFTIDLGLLYAKVTISRQGSDFMGMYLHRRIANKV
jgi:hypothetical protein